MVISVSGKRRFTACAIRCADEWRSTSRPSGDSGATGTRRQSAARGRDRSTTAVAEPSTRAATARATALRSPPLPARRALPPVGGARGGLAVLLARLERVATLGGRGGPGPGAAGRGGRTGLRVPAVAGGAQRRPLRTGGTAAGVHLGVRAAD